VIAVARRSSVRGRKPSTARAGSARPSCARSGQSATFKSASGGVSYFASSFERGRGGDRARHSDCRPVPVHQHFPAPRPCAAGGGDVLAASRRGLRETQQFAGAGDGSRASLVRLPGYGRLRRRRAPVLRRAGKCRPDRNRRPRSRRPSNSFINIPPIRWRATARRRGPGCETADIACRHRDRDAAPIAAGVLGMARTTLPPHTSEIEAMACPP